MVSTYLVLLVMFRSIVLPLKALVINTLSILASYGALVVVFQEGALADILGFRPLGFIEASLPIVLFWRGARIASYMLLPYLGWVTFAAILNLAVVRLNAPFG